MNKILGKVTVIENGDVHVYPGVIEREIVLISLVVTGYHDVSGDYFEDGSFDLELKSKDKTRWKDMNLLFHPIKDK